MLFLFVIAGLEGCDTKTQQGPWVQDPAVDPPTQGLSTPSTPPPPLLPEPPGDPVASKYTGSHWKLIGFVNGTTGEVQMPESISGDLCYWLRLNTNHSYLLNTSGDILYGSYNVDTLKQTIAFSPRSYPLGMSGEERTVDGQSLKESFAQVSRYLRSEAELKLFYQENVYLLFERMQELPYPSSIAGSRWRLTGLGNEKTGGIRVPEAATKPENYWMYIVWFRTDGRIVGHSTSNNLTGAYQLDQPGLLQIQAGSVTDVGERDDYTFLDVLSGQHTYAYSLRDDELRIYYNDSLYLQLKTY
jgi:hypothetical protein